MTSKEHFNTKILKHYSENGSLMIVFHDVLRTVEIVLYKFWRWACGKLVVLDLSEPVQQIGEKLFAVLDDKQRQELVKYILAQKFRVRSNTSPYSVSVHAMSDSLNTKLTEIHTESLYFCLENRIVSVGDTEIKLTVKEFDIFALLIMNPDRVLTYNMIVDLVWNEKEIRDNVTFLSALRMLERMTERNLLTPAETEQAKKELKRRLRPTLLLA